MFTGIIMDIVKGIFGSRFVIFPKCFIFHFGNGKFVTNLSSYLG